MQRPAVLPARLAQNQSDSARAQHRCAAAVSDDSGIHQRPCVSMCLTIFRLFGQRRIVGNEEKEEEEENIWCLGDVCPSQAAVFLFELLESYSSNGSYLWGGSSRCQRQSCKPGFPRCARVDW